MISPADIHALNQRSNEELRQLIAAAAGLHAARDGDGGAMIAMALERVSSRRRYEPRKTA